MWWEAEVVVVVVEGPQGSCVSNIMSLIHPAEWSAGKRIGSPQGHLKTYLRGEKKSLTAHGLARVHGILQGAGVMTAGVELHTSLRRRRSTHVSTAVNRGGTRQSSSMSWFRGVSA